MSGKIAAALVAAAVTSGSAATVGIVYSKFASHNSSGDESSTVKSAVVINASEAFFDSSHVDGVDGDAPACPNREDAKGCVVVTRAAEIKLNILGYTVSIPPIWLGGDSDDRYANAARDFFAPVDPLSEFELGHHHRVKWEFGDERQEPRSDGQTSTVSLQQTSTSQTESAPAQPLFLNDVTPPPTDGPSFEFFDAVNFGNVGNGGGTTSIPEPSTWLMMLTGAGWLGFLKRRRVAALVRPVAKS